MIQSSAHRLAIPVKFDGEPEEKLNHRHHADPKAKSNSERKFNQVVFGNLWNSETHFSLELLITMIAH